MAPDETKLPPEDRESEMCLLASLMIGGLATFTMHRASLHRSLFCEADHQAIFDALCGLASARMEFSGVSINAMLNKAGVLNEIGGMAYIRKLLELVPHPHELPSYLRICRDMHIRRQLLTLASRATQAAHAPRQAYDAHETAQRLAGDFANAAAAGSPVEYSRLDAEARKAHDALSEPSPDMIPSGFADLDKTVGGISIGEMAVLGARPSMGKSTLARQWAYQVAANGIPAAIISLEEPKQKMARNYLAYLSGVENHRIRAKTIIEPEWEALADGLLATDGVPLFLSQKARRIDDIRSTVSLLVAREGVRFVVIDYLQRIRGLQGRSTYERVSEASIEVSDMGKEAGVALLVAAQLNREVAHRDDKRPTMEDLRESGQIEQDADAVLLLHREDYYHTSDEVYQPTKIAEMIVAKWRDAARGKAIFLQSQLKYQRFAPYASAAAEPVVPWE